jgi:hypothetical protein
MNTIQGGAEPGPIEGDHAADIVVEYDVDIFAPHHLRDSPGFRIASCTRWRSRTT